MKRYRALIPFLIFFLRAVACGREDDSSRPKIGLVLGGGGALGISHIGVLRVLEEQRVPIDYICGTSMGAIIGGLYANGMSPDEIQAFLEGLDWNEVMSDETPRRELYFRRKLESQRYVIKMGVGREGLKLGTGLAAGQKFNNLLQLQVQRTADITDFDQLPIPYRAVATDLQAGAAYVIDHGDLSRAMRASMAVPGAFTTVELDGRLLVDGGIVNNLPVDVAREMGADLIIAVDVGSASDHVEMEELESLPGILARTYAIMQRPEQIKQFETADIGLRPKLADFTASQFHRVSELVPPGEAAARAQLAELSTLSISPEEYQRYLERQRRADPPPPRIKSVEVAGNHRVSERSIRGRIYSEPGALFDPRVTEHDLMRVFGIGEFEQVLRELEKSADGSSTLTYEVMEDPVGPLYLAAGIRLHSNFENDTDWSVLLNLTRRSLNALGAEWRNEVVLGTTQGVLSEFYQPLNYGGYFFVAPTVDFRSEIQDLYDDKDHVAEYNVDTSEVVIDFGVQLRHFAELRVGPVVGNGQGNVKIGLAGLPEFDDDFVGPAFSLIVDREDRTYFSREGYYFMVEGFFPDEAYGGDVSYNKLSVAARKNYSINDHTVTVELKYGGSLGTDLPGYTQFTLGGPIGFSGLAKDQFRGSTLGVGSLGYRYRLKELPSQLGKGIYALTWGDVGNVWEDEMNSDVRYGATVGLGVDLNFAPLAITYGYAAGGYHSFYFSLGNQF